jgi:hypothetical protein
MSELENRVEVLERKMEMAVKRIAQVMDVALAAGRIRQKLQPQLQMLNAPAWLGEELRRLDATLQELERPIG